MQAKLNESSKQHYEYCSRTALRKSASLLAGLCCANQSWGEKAYVMKHPAFASSATHAIGQL